MVYFPTFTVKINGKYIIHGSYGIVSFWDGLKLTYFNTMRAGSLRECKLPVSWFLGDLLLMENFQGFIHPRWCLQISSINSTKRNAVGRHPWEPPNIDWTPMNSWLFFVSTALLGFLNHGFQQYHSIMWYHTIYTMTHVISESYDILRSPLLGVVWSNLTCAYVFFQLGWWQTTNELSIFDIYGKDFLLISWDCW